MKQIFTSQILRKMLILFCLIVGLVFAISSGNVRQVAASRCCETCARDGSVPYADIGAANAYCTNQCGASSGTCFNSCMNSMYSCWSTCDTGC
jgi:hypothetical protein